MSRIIGTGMFCLVLVLVAGPAVGEGTPVQELVEAAKTGDEVSVKILLEDGAPANGATPEGVTPLQAAAHGRSKAVVALLLEKGAVVNAKSGDGNTALHIAAERCANKVIPTLLEAGADLAAVNTEGATPLHFAAMRGCLRTVTQLVEAGAKVGAKAKNDLTPLHMAAQAWYEEAIPVLLEAGAAVEATTKDGYTPLHLAANAGFDKNVTALLDGGASVTAAAKDGGTALYFAAGASKWSVVEILLDKGADPGISSGTGESPLHMILRADYQQALTKKIIEKTQDPNLRTETGLTPIYLAAMKGDSELVSLLLEKGADPNIKGPDDVPPLAVARFEGWSKVVEVLEGVGAVDAEPFFYLYNAAAEGDLDKLRMAIRMPGTKDVVNQASKGGITPLHAAAADGCDWCVLDLIALGAGLEPTDDSGNTPLHYAVGNKKKDVCRILIAAGASLEVKNKEGHSPRSFAVQLGDDRIAKYMLTPALIAAAKAGKKAPIDAFVQGGGDINANDFRRTLFGYAVLAGQMKLADHLDSLGAYAGSDPNGAEPVIFVAIRERNTAALRYLLKVRPSQGIAGRWGASPLHIAASAPWREGVDMLIEAGADVNGRTKSFALTPLFYAVAGGDLEIVRVLLDKGADPKHNEKPQGTPLHWAAREGKADIARLLLDRGADVNAQVEEYWDTPLHEATSSLCLIADDHGPWHPTDEEAFYRGKPAMVQLLLRYGAVPSLLTSYGASPLDGAVDPEIIRILEAAGAPSPLKDKREKQKK